MRYKKLSEVSEEVTIKEGTLYFGKREVITHDMKITEDHIPCLFTVRVFENNYWRLATTMDLHDRGFWLCGGRTKAFSNYERFSMPSCTLKWFQQVETLLNEWFEDTAGKEWKIFVDDVD